MTDKFDTSINDLGLPVDILNKIPGGYHCCIDDEENGYPFVFIGDRFLEITGWTREEIEDRFENKFPNMVHPEDLDIALKYHAKGPNKYDLGEEDKVYRILGKNGYIWVTGTANEARINGRDYIQGTISNITSFLKEEEQYKRALEESNKKAENYNEQLRDQLLIINSVAEVFICLYYIDMKDYSFVELGKTTDDVRMVIGEKGDARLAYENMCKYLVHDTYRDRIKEFTELSNLSERLKDKQWISHPFIDFNSEWMEGFFIAAERDEEGNCKHAIWGVKNIHEEKTRELSYRNTLKKNEDIIAAAGMGVWNIFLFDNEKPRMTANAKMRELLSLPAEVTDENEIYEAWHSRIKPEALESVNASVAAMMSGEKNENTYLWIDPILGEQYVRCGGVAEKVEGKGWILRGYHYNVNKEVLEEQQKQRDLEEALKAAEVANKAKTNFLYNMSHDIRTPLNAILGYSNLLKMGKNPDKHDEYLEKIEQSGEYLLGIINNILDMARIDSGETKLDLESYVIDERVNYSDLFYADVKKKNLHISQEMDIEHRHVIGDLPKIKQIVMNLVSNAIKYTPDNGHIHVSMKELPCDIEDSVKFRFSVKDDGIGMSEDFQKHLFDSFTRERNTTESKILGTGLGLSIVKKLVDLMSATITVESKMGQGSCFTIEIVQKKTDTNTNDKDLENETVDVGKFAGKRILLAEDNELNAEIAVEILNDMGIIVDHVEDGLKCVARMDEMEAGTYQLILMDVQMPVMDGYKASQNIRSFDDREKAGIPIFAMTANAFEEDKKNAYAAGMNGHVAKPININELIKTLSTVLCNKE
ncbi:MAG: ATP-binding protein [Erysipelotrichaceae bacterium]|nr:ATP-binding protein [Erysipelotrichaceae bacterium]